MTIPAVSVVIPLYNKKEFIKRAVDSVLNQTWSDYELIIVNDGSTDGSEKILKSYSDPRLNIINQSNKGEGSARNAGIKQAKAKLIAFLDADDEWHPEFLDTIYKLWIEHPNAGLIGTAYDVINSNNECNQYIYNKKSDLYESYFSTFIKMGRSPINSSSFASTKRVLESISGYNENMKIGEDLDIYCRISLRYPFAYSPAVESTIYQNTNKNTLGLLSEPISAPLEDIYTDIISKINKNDRSLFEFSDFRKCYNQILLFTILRNMDSNFMEFARKQTKKHIHCSQSPIFAGIHLLTYCPHKIYYCIRKCQRMIFSINAKYR